MKKFSRGFTIVELLVVIVVIGIFASLVVVAYNGISQRAKDNILASDKSSVSRQLEAFYVINGKYPSENDCLATGPTEICLKTSSGNTVSYTPLPDASTATSYSLLWNTGGGISSVNVVVAAGGSGGVSSFGTYCSATSGGNGTAAGTGAGGTGTGTGTAVNYSGGSGGATSGSNGGGGGGAAGVSGNGSNGATNGGNAGVAGGDTSGAGGTGGVYGANGNNGSAGTVPIIAQGSTMLYTFGGGGGGGGGYAAGGGAGGIPGGGGGGTGGTYYMYYQSGGLGARGQVTVWEFTSTGATGSPVSMQTFTANGTWTKPSGINSVKVLVIGAGGTGQGPLNDGAYLIGRGAGGGGSCRNTVNV